MLQCGLDKNTSAKLEKTEANEFALHLNAIVNAMVDGSVKFGEVHLLLVVIWVLPMVAIRRIRIITWVILLLIRTLEFFPKQLRVIQKP